MFGRENFVCQICYQTAPYATSNTLPVVHDYILWYAKNKKELKYHALFKSKEDLDSLDLYRLALSPDGKTYRPITEIESATGIMEKGWRRYRLVSMISQGASSEPQGFVFNGKTYYPPSNSHWKVRVEAMENIAKANRIQATANSVQFRSFIDDFPISVMHNIWTDTITGSFNDAKVYVVQTGTKVIQRCMLMTTDPGDLVLDITCGSGTTALVAEQWGRRWITCDTSRVAIALAKQRLMTATFDYYKLAHENQGVGSGFLYKQVPHITMGSIAYNEKPQQEILYDQPEVDKSKVRITGPFTVEALPAPVVKPLDDVSDAEEDFSAKQTDWRDQLLATGILGRGGNRLEFSRVEPLSGTKFLQAEAETKESNPRRAVICFAGETKPLDSRMVAMALDEAEMLRPAPKLIIFAAFQFDPEAAKDIDEMNWPGVTLLKAQMNTDLMTEDLKKKRSSDQSFWLVGQPDVELIRDGRSKTKFKVKVHGFDYYDVKKGTVESGSTSRIAMWMLDISVGMLSEGWDAKTVTHILGLRAFSSQLLCEQVVGRGMRRTSYDLAEGSDMFTPEYVNIFGIPFTFLPHETDEQGTPPVTPPKTQVEVLKERSEFEIRWPNIIRIDRVFKPQLKVDLNKIDTLELNAADTRLRADLAPIIDGKTDLTKCTEIDLQKLDAELRLQRIIFEASGQVYDLMKASWQNESTKFALLGQVIRLVEKYLNSGAIVINPPLFNTDPVRQRIIYMMNMNKIVQHLWSFIKLEQTERIAPVFDPNKRVRSTADMPTWFTSKPCFITQKSHISHCVFDSTWETPESYIIQKNPHVKSWVKNDHLGFEILYIFDGVVRKYIPDFLIQLDNDKVLVLETKGQESRKDKEKRKALSEWISAVNALGEYGFWCNDVSYNVADVDGIIAKYV